MFLKNFIAISPKKIASNFVFGVVTNGVVKKCLPVVLWRIVLEIMEENAPISL